jgi:hypothetical protein
MSMIAAAGDFIISVEYDPTGREWASMWDNEVVGWRLDEEAPQGEPVPVIVGSMVPELSADISPIESPPWLWGRSGAHFLIAPDRWRGTIEEGFEWLARNNGANRELRGKFLREDLAHFFSVWQRGL